MVSVIAKFDGEKIELPEQLRGAAPGDVLIVYPASERGTPSVPHTQSIWDVFGKAPTPRTREDIQSQVRSERDSWDER
jgi:hypothetical protein